MEPKIISSDSNTWHAFYPTRVFETFQEFWWIPIEHGAMLILLRRINPDISCTIIALLKIEKIIDSQMLTIIKMRA